MKFIDEVTITVASGKGGPGKISFRRESMAPRGGPDGGDGGRGGDVIIRVDPRLNSLLDLRLKRKYAAGDGEPGAGDNRSGQQGQDLLLPVPAGTVFKDMDGNIIVDMAEHSEYTLLKGGLGGKGNVFYKSSINQAPNKAQKGMPGQELSVQLELKLIADVGIIGFPNVGKSTLISHISAARPKVADYPFTTLVPNLGVVKFGEDRNYVVADIPGLIPGAHKGVGLGTQFLRHIERTKVFVHLIDVSEMSQRDPWEDYVAINNELEQHDQLNAGRPGYTPLAVRPQYVAFNKADTVPSERQTELLGHFHQKGVTVHMISAATGLNINKLIYDVGAMVFTEPDGDEMETAEEQKDMK